MNKPTTRMKRRLTFVLFVFELVILFLIGRVFYLQVFKAEELQKLAWEQQTRDRLISPRRGSILDRNMVGLAETMSVSTVSVINSQLKDKEGAARILSEKLDLEYEIVLKKASRKVALERIKSKVDRDLADEIRALDIPGVVVDEDIKRVYPYSSLASQVIGFVGKDNQGIIGLESKYEEYLKGNQGKILTETDVKGIELPNTAQKRIDPVSGYNLVTTIDVIVQQYAEQTLSKIVEAKDAKRGSIIVLNPQNGEVLAMANKPDFDLNEPFTINDPLLDALWDGMSQKERNDALNQMWRNFTINDTYEPGSTFKIFTSAAGLAEGIITKDSSFSCPGYRNVAGRMIKCWRYPRSHGHETFTEGVQNSCNPVFMDVAESLGAQTFYEYLREFGFNEKTGIDLPGEAVGIMHNLKKVGPVELATMSFGQSFQITPLQLLRGASAVVNGGFLITPHLGKAIVDDENNIVETFDYDLGRKVIPTETSEIMKEILESVVSVGTGNRTYIPGYRIGGKTATSEKLPRRSGKYIASFMAFAPAEDPQVMAIIMVDEPKGVYYGGQVTGPVMKELFENILPYLEIEPKYTEAELKLVSDKNIELPDFTNETIEKAKAEILKLKLKVEVNGIGDTVSKQFPPPGELISSGSIVTIYTE